MYSVTDAGILKQRGEPIFQKQINELIDLCYAAKRVADDDTIEKIELEVRTVNPDHEYQERTEHWLSEEWVTIGYCSFDNGSPEWNWKKDPPKIENPVRI